MNKYKLNNLLMIILILISLSSLNILFYNLYNAYFRSENILNSENENKDEYRLVDLEESTSNFIRDLYKVNALKSFYNEFTQNDNFIFYESIIQPINILDFKGNEIFLYNYEENNYENESQNSIVKQLLINDEYGNKMNIPKSILEGNYFSKEDFYINNYNEIPVILGYEYIDIYNIGDIINIMFQNDVYGTYKVIGFLKKNSYATVNKELIFLDRYIISPSLVILNKPKSLEELTFQGFLYLQKINGIVKLLNEYSLQDFILYLERLIIKYDIFEITLLNYSAFEINSLKLLIYENLNVLISLLILLSIFILVSISAYIIIIIKSSLYKYRVYLLCGYSIRDIKISILLRLLLITLIPTIILIVYTYTFIEKFLFQLIIFDLLFLLVTYILILILINIYLKNSDIEKILIKGDNND